MRIFEDVGRIGGIIAALEESGEIFTADMVAELYRRGCADGFMAFARKTVMNLRHEGKLRTAENYTSALNSFARFRGNLGDVPVREVNSALMAAYEDWLSSAGICRNTSSFYMRNLRAIWNRAPECGAGQCGNPFRHVYTGIGKTVKRAVPVNAIRRIRDMSLEGGYGFARDIFMFSFYTRGMSFVDMAYLRKSDLRNGVLSYRRRKTGQRLLIKWERPPRAEGGHRPALRRQLQARLPRRGRRGPAPQRCGQEDLFRGIGPAALPHGLRLHPGPEIGRAHV